MCLLQGYYLREGDNQMFHADGRGCNNYKVLGWKSIVACGGQALR